MKWLILIIFAVAFICSMGWYEATERNLTIQQKNSLGIAALVAWVLVLALGNTVL
jgi:hypothetical protein